MLRQLYMFKNVDINDNKYIMAVNVVFSIFRSTAETHFLVVSFLLHTHKKGNSVESLLFAIK